jgi:hypothetical protein
MNNSHLLRVKHAPECQRLRAKGMTKAGIAKLLGISEHTVRLALASNEEEQEIQAKKKAKTDYYGIWHNPQAKPIPVKRAPSQPISKEVKDAALLAFARFEINRAQLMFLITPQDKWRGKSWGEP